MKIRQQGLSPKPWIWDIPFLIQQSVILAELIKEGKIPHWGILETDEQYLCMLRRHESLFPVDPPRNKKNIWKCQNEAYCSIEKYTVTFALGIYVVLAGSMQRK